MLRDISYRHSLIAISLPLHNLCTHLLKTHHVFHRKLLDICLATRAIQQVLLVRSADLSTFYHADTPVHCDIIRKLGLNL